MQTEQQEGRSQDERDKTDLRAFFTPDRTKCSGSNLPGAMPIPTKNRFILKYKDFMTTFKEPLTKTLEMKGMPQHLVQTGWYDLPGRFFVKSSTLIPVDTRYETTRVEQRQEESQGESQTPKQSTESDELEQDRHLTKKLQVTAVMKSSSNGKKSSKDTTLIQSKPISSHRSIFEKYETTRIEQRQEERQGERYDLPGGIIVENSAGMLAKTWPELMQTEQQEGRSQNGRDKTNLRAFSTPDRIKCSGSDLPGAMSTPPKNRFLFKYKDFLTTFKDDNKKVENHEEALKDPNLDEYHSMTGREEDDAHKSKTLQNRTHLRTNHVVNPTLSDRQGQVAATQYGKSSTPVTGKGS